MKNSDFMDMLKTYFFAGSNLAVGQKGVNRLLNYAVLFNLKNKKQNKNREQKI